MPELAPALPHAPPRGGGWRAGLAFVATLGLATLAMRSAVVMPRTIPSESMMPGLIEGDTLLIGKWPYGWSRFSLPWAPAAPHGRLFGRAPARGDVVVFRAPPDDRADYIKRVIGLPGDTVQMRGGRLWLNGRMVPRARIADLVLPMGRNVECRSVAPPPYGAAAGVCRLPRYRETLPGGRRYDTIDQGWSPLDDTAAVTVPPGRYLMLGDNRDMSEDSRVATARGGIGLVPAENLEGRALVVLVSSAGGGTMRWARSGRPIG